MMRQVWMWISILVSAAPAARVPPEPPPSLQERIDAAAEGDTIWVERGTYMESLDFRGKALLLSGVDPLDRAVVQTTVIDASEQHTSTLHFLSGEGPDTRVRGLTITGGKGTPYLWGPNDGESTAGGGMICVGSSPTIESCVIRDNRTLGVDSVGGGGYCVAVASPTFRDCEFGANSARWGATLYVTDPGTSVAIADSRFVGECVRRDVHTDALYLRRNTALRMEDCVFEDSDCYFCIYSAGATVTVERCVLRDSRSSFVGLSYESEGATSSIRNCIIHDNISFEPQFRLIGVNPEIEHCTVFANESTYQASSMISVYGGTPALSHSIFWGNLPEAPTIEVEGAGVVDVDHCDIWGYWGRGNFYQDPLLRSWGDHRGVLAPGSPCIDAGSREREDGLAWPPRYPNGVRADLGAYGGPEAAGWAPWGGAAARSGSASPAWSRAPDRCACRTTTQRFRRRSTPRAIETSCWSRPGPTPRRSTCSARGSW